MAGARAVPGRRDAARGMGAGSRRRVGGRPRFLSSSVLFPWFRSSVNHGRPSSVSCTRGPRTRVSFKLLDPIETPILTQKSKSILLKSPALPAIPRSSRVCDSETVSM
jgi:hypothetical protein